MSAKKLLELPLIAALALACQARGGPEDGAASAEVALPAPIATATPRCVPATLVAQRGTPTLDGQLDQPVWHAARATDAFVDPRHAAPVPHTEARASFDADALFIALYVADDDMRSTDRVRVEFGPDLGIEASPDRQLRCRAGTEGSCAALGVQAAFSVDGDVDNAEQEDEEWVVTLRVPWKTLAPAGRPGELPVALRREDIAGGRAKQTAWNRGCGAIRLE